MDLPPLPPPIASADANDAGQSARRLNDIHAWLQAHDDQLPQPPPDPSRHAETLRSIEAFWNTSIAFGANKTALTRREALSRQLAQVAIDDAVLRLADRTLSANAGVLLRSLSTDPDAPLPAHIHAEELVTGDTPHAGTFVLRSALHPDVVLLFSTHRGWREFSSHRDILPYAERDLRQSLASQVELPGISRDAIETRLDGAFLDIRPLTGPLFPTVTDGIIARHGEKIDRSFASDEPDAFFDASSLHELVDLRSMDLDRSALRAARSVESPYADIALANEPEHLRDDIAKAKAQHDMAELRAADAVIAGFVVPPRSMDNFLRDELTTRLRRLGVEDSPDAIRVRTCRFPFGIVEAAGALIQGCNEPRVSLLDAARWNAGVSDTDMLTILDESERPHPRLQPHQVRTMVRSIDAGRRYAEHVEDHKGDSDLGRRYRQIERQRWIARVNLDAAHARLMRHGARRAAGFLPDARERGFQWVKATLATPEPRRRRSVDGEDLVVQQLTYKGAVVSDVFVIAARHPDASSHVVVYTPDAPDCSAFREFSSRDAMIRDFLVDRAFETYLLDRLPPEFRTTDSHGLSHFKVADETKTLRWAFSSDDCGFCTTLAEPFAYRDVITDIADAAYDANLEQTRRTIAYASRTTDQADRDAANQWYRMPHAITRMPGEATALVAQTTVQGVAHATASSWRLYDDIKTGDYAQAFIDAVSVYVNALDIATLGPSPRTWSRSVLRRAVKTAGLRRYDRAPAYFAQVDTSIPSHVGSSTAAPDGLTLVPEAQWPGEAYYYAAPSELDRLDRVGMLVLPQAHLDAAGTRGVPIVALPPTQLAQATRLPHAWIPGHAEGNALPGRWVRIDLHGALRGENLSASAFEVYRRTGDDGTALVLRPASSLPAGRETMPLILFDHYAVKPAPKT